MRRKEALEKLKKRLYASQEHIRNDIVETGGWKTIHGAPRFIPLGIKRSKPRHCTSCLYFQKIGYCSATGAFCNPYSEACDGYVNRTWRNR